MSPITTAGSCRPTGPRPRDLQERDRHHARKLVEDTGLPYRLSRDPVSTHEELCAACVAPGQPGDAYQDEVKNAIRGVFPAPAPRQSSFLQPVCTRLFPHRRMSTRNCCSSSRSTSEGSGRVRMNGARTSPVAPRNGERPGFSVPFSGWCCGSGSASPAPTRPHPAIPPGLQWSSRADAIFHRRRCEFRSSRVSPPYSVANRGEGRRRGRASPPLPVEDVDNRAAVFRHLRPHGPEVAGGRDFRAVGHPQTAFVSGMASSPAPAPTLHRAVDAHSTGFVECTGDRFPESRRRRPLRPHG